MRRLTNVTIQFVLVPLLLHALIGSAEAQTESGDTLLRDQNVERVSLDDLDEFAMQNAPAVTEATERIGLAQAEREGAKVVFPANPSLEGGIANKFIGGYGLRKFEVGLRQSIEIAGERGTRLESARKLEEELRAELEATRWDVHRQVHTLYYRALVAERRVRLALEVTALAETLEETTQQRKSAGEVGLIDLQVARAEAARAREALVESRARLEDRALKLAEVAGWTKSALPLPEGELPEVQAAPSADELVERALEHEPTLTAIQARKERAEAQLKEARRDVWPNPTIGVAYEEESRLGPNKEQSFWIRLGLPLPIWQKNQTRKATARVERSIAERQLTNRQERLETRIRREVRSVNRAAERVDIFGEDVIPSFKKQTNLLEQGYELGELSILDVYNAQDRLLKVQRRYLIAINDYFRALGDLERSLGTEIWPHAEAE